MLLVGDWCPGHLRVELSLPSDIILANLEGPVLPEGVPFLPQPKAGPCLFSTRLPDAKHKLIFSLANNHIMDYGPEGLTATVQELEKIRADACGAGKDLQEARKALIIREKGVQVGIISCCEAQFGVARQNQAGVAEFGPWIYKAIRDLREDVDAVIVSFHAAVEDSPWPSPFIRELFQSYIDEGAAVVHGHHAHVPQGYEEYAGCLIFYGMGNFAVDPEKWQESPNALWSLGAEIDFSSHPFSWRLMTFEIRNKPESETIAIEESSKDEQILRRHHLLKCNRPLAEPHLLDGLWQEVALRAYYRYGANYMGCSGSAHSGRLGLATLLSSGLRTAFSKRAGASSSLNRSDHMLRYHMVACESHRQVLTTALGILAGEIRDMRTDETKQLADEMMPWSVGVNLP